MDLAVHSIREANRIWVGVGAYTVNELFFLAGQSQIPLSLYYVLNRSLIGIPIGIRECDLFGNPSRTARLVDAFWTLAHVAELELP